jgi:hypothetical protein
MREYKRAKYNDDKQKARAYSNSIVAKRSLPPEQAAEMWRKFGHHLADVMKLQKLMERIPHDLLMELVASATTAASGPM